MRRAGRKVSPEVTEAAVVGVPNPTWTQMVVAFVVCPPGVLDDATVRNRLRGVLAGYKNPKRVHFVEALPRDPFQVKVRRTELRAA
jgi:acyl-coenzyme A synthetase/AMP-(fatty) acid ligase